MMTPALTPGLRLRLILPLLAAFVVLTGVILWQSFNQRDYMVGVAAKDLVHHARMIAVKQQSIVTKAQAILNGLVLRPEIRSGVPDEDCSRFLAARLRQEAGFVQMGKVLPNGDLACAALPPDGGPDNYADRYWFQQALATPAMVVSEVRLGRVAYRPTIGFAQAMRDGAGNISSVVYLALDLDWLQAELKEAALPEGHRLLVVDSQGAVAASYPDLEGAVGRNIVQLPMFTRIMAHAGAGTAEDIGLDGVPRLIAYTPLLETDSGLKYHLWLTVPKAVVEAPAQRELRISLAIALAILAGMMGGLLWSGHRVLVRPLVTLSRAAARLGAGDFEARTGIPHADDDIGRLARTLDEAAASIEERDRGLKRANRALRIRSATNLALLHARGEHELVQAMCRSLVEAGDFRMAWAGYAEDGRPVWPVAAWSAKAGSLESLKMARDVSEWDQAQRYGCASSLVLPLRRDGSVIGVLNIYAVEADAFDTDMAEVLGGVADDLAFGIVTQRARVALTTAEERFRAMFESSRDAIMTTEPPNWYFTTCNPATLALFGAADKAALMRLGPWDVSPEVQPDGQLSRIKAARMIDIAMREGSHFFEWTHRKLNGESFPATVLLTRMSFGGRDMLLATIRDVTQEEAAKSQLRKLSLVVEQSPEIIIITNLDGEIEYVNQSYVSSTGYSLEEVLGENPRIHRSGKTPKETYDALWDVLAGGRTWKGEFFNKRKDGSEYVVAAIVAPIFQANGRASHYLAIEEDITERKRIADELHHYQHHLQELVAERTAQLEASNAEREKAAVALQAAYDQLEQRVIERTRQLRQLAVDTTLAEERERQAIARDLHDDLGQILHVAKIKLSSLAKRDAGDIGPSVRELNRLIADASARVRSLTSQLSPPVLETMGLIPALSWLAEELERSYGLLVDMEDDGLPKPLTQAQAAILFRAVRELLINVAKHAGTSFARVSAQADGGTLILKVEDEGAGIDELHQAQAWQSGYGLTSVRERITFLNGTMEIRATPGEGTTVMLRMPLEGSLAPSSETTS